MQTIKLLKAIEAEGLSEGDVIAVDEFSAEALIKRGDAEEYEAAQVAEERPRTIDDLVDPDVARNKRVMNATVVGGPADGPVYRSPDLDPSEPPTVADDATTAEAEAALVDAAAVVDGTGTEHTGTLPTSSTADAPAKNTKARGGKATTGTTTEASGAQPVGGDAGGGTP